jgi:4-hydroxythreonine-4-phosphate dehydrogenase
LNVIKPHPRIAITAGEPAGIGPDLCVMLANKPLEAEVVIIADVNMLLARATALNLAIQLHDYSANSTNIHHGNGSITVLHQTIGNPVVAGQLDARNSQDRKSVV